MKGFVVLSFNENELWGGPSVIISLLQPDKDTESRLIHCQQIDLEQVAVGYNVAIRCPFDERHIYVKWKQDVIRIEYRSGR